jgi:hypothetical protein
MESAPLRVNDATDTTGMGCVSIRQADLRGLVILSASSLLRRSRDPRAEDGMLLLLLDLCRAERASGMWVGG